MRWASVGTKPDWSAEQLLLWIEAKYARRRSDLVRITEAIAADITKYSDSGRRVLFIVYDPTHVIVDEEGFREPQRAHAGIQIEIVR